MTTLFSMKEKLLPLNLYDLGENSLVCKEITVFANEIDLLLSAIKECEQECFINTATNFGLKQWEDILGLRHEHLDISTRRKLIVTRISLLPSEITVAGVNQFISAFNVLFNTFEYPNVLYLHIQCVGDYDLPTKEKVTSEIEKSLPAHLEVFVDFTNNTFEKLDNKNRTFEQLDNLNLQWLKIDMEE